MQNRSAIGDDRNALKRRFEARLRHVDVIVADRNSVESKFATLIGDGLFREIGADGRQRNRGGGDRAMLRIVDEAANIAENTGLRERGNNYRNCARENNTSKK